MLTEHASAPVTPTMDYKSSALPRHIDWWFMWMGSISIWEGKWGAIIHTYVPTYPGYDVLPEKYGSVHAKTDCTVEYPHSNHTIPKLTHYSVILPVLPLYTHHST